MSRYDGLIIPRSYSEYLNKTDAATLSQMLQLSGVLDRTLTAGSNKPITNGVVAGALDFPKDATLHYSFDDIPTYPDGAAEVKLLKNNTYELQSTEYRLRNNVSSTEFSNVNGNVQATITGKDYAGCYIRNSEVTQKYIKLKIKVKALVGTLVINTGASAFSKTITSIGVYEYAEFHNSTATNNSLYFFCQGVGNSCTFELLEIYIGNGSYATPIIDNSGNNNNAINNGGIAIAGLSGKSAYFVSNSYADLGTDIKLTPNFSIALWIKPDNNVNTLVGNILKKNSAIVLRNGNADYPKLTLDFYGAGGNFFTNYELAPLLTPNVWSHIVLVREGTTLKYYLNGVLDSTVTLSDNTIAENDNSLTLGGASDNPNTRPQTIDDFLIFSRAITDAEVQALYMNKGNTPNYTNVNNYKLNKLSFPVSTVVYVAEKTYEAVSVDTTVTEVGQYDYNVLPSVPAASIPTGYHVEYICSWIGGTSGNNKLQVYVNNIACGEVSSFTHDEKFLSAISKRFKQSDIVLEPVLTYLSNGINIKVKLIKGTTNGSAYLRSLAITAFLVADEEM